MYKDIYVNAHISNISFPTTIEELEVFIDDHGMYNVEEVLNYTSVCWSVPRSSQIGDIVLFYHAKTTSARISALTRKVRELPDELLSYKEELLSWLERARVLYKAYGGKIFAVARIVGTPEYSSLNDEEDELYHWRGRVYAEVSDIVPLDMPVDISEFSSFLKISRQSGITPIPATEFRQLRKIIASKNSNMPKYYMEAQIGSVEFSSINRKNFLEKSKEHQFRFILEIDFRSYYVDYLLQALFGKKVWSECRCQADGKNDSFVDNVFYFNGRYYLLEVKLNVHVERDLNGQLQQYISADRIFLKKEEIVENFEKEYMFVIDTKTLYRYDSKEKCLTELIEIGHVTSAEDVRKALQF